MAIQLTRQQAAQVEWALGPMDDHWCSESGAHGRAGLVYQESDLPRLDGLTIVLSTIEDINADLLYRLEVQLQDMAEEESTPQARGDAKAAMAVADKMRKVALAHLPIGGGWI